MKKLIYLLPLLFVGMMFQSCDPDPVVAPLDPDLTFVSGAGIVSGDVTLAPDSVFTIRVNGSSGDNILNGLTIQEDGSTVDPTTITVNGVQPASGTIALAGANENNFTFDITFTAKSAASTTVYSFLVSDVTNRTDQVSLSVTVEKISAALAFSEEMGNFFMDGEVIADQLFKVKLIANGGSAEINSLTVYRDDVAMMTDELFYNSQNFAENPLILMGDDRAGFCSDLLVRAHSSGVSEYAFEIADTDGETQRLSFNLAAGTPVDSQKVVLLLNKDGGQGIGGVNLITGESVNSGDSFAHIRDLGIDLNLPAATNWIQKIAPGVNASMRILDDNAPEGFSFENADTKEKIQAAFETGMSITESEVVEVDDLFLVEKDGIYFVLKVNAVMITTGDNDDQYEIEVKF